MLDSKRKEILESYPRKSYNGCKIYPILLTEVLFSAKTRHKTPRTSEGIAEVILTTKDIEGDLKEIESKIQRTKKGMSNRDIFIKDIKVKSEHGMTVPNAYGEGFKLRDYQEDMVSGGVKILSEHNIVIYALEMRLGKTHVALETCKRKKAKSVLFVTPKAAISSIHDDYKEGGYDFEIEVINYESLHNVKNTKPDIVICDEFHKIGSMFPRASKKAKQLKEMLSYNPPVIFLSGTPTPESYSQIFNSLNISPSSPFKDYPNFYKWAKDYVKVYERPINGLKIKFYDAADTEKVVSAYSHLILSHTQKEAGFNYEVEDKVHLVEMKKGTYWVADKIKQDKLYEPKDGGVILADTPVKLMSKLHQIYSGTVIKQNDDGTNTPIFFDSTKIDFIKDNFKDKRIAIFYVFDEEGVQLRKAFKDATDDSEEFQNKKSDTFISQVKRVKEGVKLDTADVIVFYNLGFSSTEYIQARQRLQSINRETPPTCHFIFAKGGIEEKVYKIVKSKKNFTARYYDK